VDAVYDGRAGRAGRLEYDLIVRPDARIDALSRCKNVPTRT